jgi:type II secretory pathway component PulC
MIARLRQRYTVPHEPLRSERRVELAVVVLALLVVVQLPILLGRYFVAGQVRAVPPAPDSLTVVSRNPVRTLSQQQSMEVLARPVFFASRRPLELLPGSVAADDDVDDGKKGGSLQGLKVLGIVENGERSRVIISYKGEQRRLLKGESVAGWRLTEVTPGRVVLENGDERDERRLNPVPVIAAASAGESTDQARDTAALRGAASDGRAASGAGDSQQQPLQQQQGTARRALSVGGAPIRGQSRN